MATRKTTGAFTWNPLDVVENHIGDLLSPEVAEKMATWPTLHRQHLCEALQAAAQSAEDVGAKATTLAFGQLDPEWTGHGSRTTLTPPDLNQQLLYLDSVVVHDALPRILDDGPGSATAVAQSGRRSDGDHDEILSHLDWWLLSLAELAPAIRADVIRVAVQPREDVAVTTVDQSWGEGSPTFLRRDSLVELMRTAAHDIEATDAPNTSFKSIIRASFYRARLEDPVSFLRTLADDTARKKDLDVERVFTQWNAVQAVEASGYGRRKGGPIPWESAVYLTALGLQESNYALARRFLTNVDVGACHMVATHTAREVLRLLNLQPFSTHIASQKTSAGASVLTRFQLPGIHNVPLTEVLAIRQHESAFQEFRRVLGNMLQQIDSTAPPDSDAFDAELDQAMRDHLVPELKKVQSAVKTSALEKILIPGGATLGAGALLLAAGLAFPPTAAAAVAILPAAYAAESLRRKFNKSGREARALASAYLTLTKAATRA